MFVAPIVALKINVKVDWSSCHFSQNFNIRINHVFLCIGVSLVPREILKTEATDLVAIEGILISLSYMDELRMPVAALPCILLCQNQCQYWSGQG